MMKKNHYICEKVPADQIVPLQCNDMGHNVHKMIIMDNLYADGHSDRGTSILMMVYLY